MARRGEDPMEAWFASLPAQELLPIEAQLRTVLLDCLHQKPGAFPLSEWIDRRIGGEVETRATQRGTEIYIRGNAPPAPPPGRSAGPPPAAASGQKRKDISERREDFFATLPKDDFTPQEEALRDAVFEFLATWKHQALATLNDLSEFPSVRAVRNFLPHEISLKLWLERRIGAEVELRRDPRGQDIVHLNPAAKDLVAQKAQQIASRQPPPGARLNAMSKGGKGGPPPPVAPDPGEKGGGKNAGMSQDEFLASLPADELTPQELALRKAILNFIQAVKRDPRASTPTVSDLAGDAQVSKFRAALMPAKVKLRAWVERRIGGEVELVKAPNGGDSLVVMRGDTPRVKADARAEKGKGGKGGERQEQQSRAVREFFSKLPADELTEDEAELREAILNFIPQHQESEGKEPLLVEMTDAFQKDPLLSDYLTKTLPKEVPLKAWIDHRIGGEVDTSKDSQGHDVVRLRGDEKPKGGGKNEEATKEEKEKFFATLPEDEFSAAEDALRAKVLAFITGWKKPGHPTLQQAGSDHMVAKTKLELLPKGCPVKLHEWIERRIGGEVEVGKNAQGDFIIGIPGTLDQPPNKRQRKGFR